MMNTWRVGLIYNLKQNIAKSNGGPADALAEYDSPETISALRTALESAGHEVVCLEGDQTLLDSIRDAAPDICFNIAEGLRGDARESHVPAVLEILGIPYTGARITGHAISLDKALAKRLWRDCGLPVAPFQTFIHGNESVSHELSYPLFAKPVREGTGMGINGHSIIHDRAALRKQVQWIIQSYRQPALVENYLPGREFTVGIIGNALQPGETPRNDLYNARGYHLFPVLEIDANCGAGEGLYNAASKSYNPGEKGAPLYLCPADIPDALEEELKQLTTGGFEAVDGLDLSRVDFRLGADGRPYLMEINTLPGLNPIVSDICIMAQAEGMEYARLINEILQLAAERYARQGIGPLAGQKELAASGYARQPVARL